MPVVSYTFTVPFSPPEPAPWFAIGGIRTSRVSTYPIPKYYSNRGAKIRGFLHRQTWGYVTPTASKIDRCIVT